MKQHILVLLITFLIAGIFFATPARAASCDVYAVTVGAHSQTSSPVIYSADAKCDSGVKGMRFSVNGNVIYELADSSHIGYWYKAADTDKLCFEAKGDDGSYSASRCVMGNSTSSEAGGVVLGTTSSTSTRVQDTTCPSSVTPRLTNGQSGRTLTNVNVRASAGIGSLRIGRLSPGTTFEVQSDATCNGGINWWKIKIQEFTGMIAESQFGSYLLAP